MIPAFRIMVAGEDATGKVADRLLGLTITDEDGTKADRLELELDNRDGRLAFPETEARIEVSLGYRGLPLALMGVYAVDGVSGSGPRLTLRITATAADLKGDIRAPRKGLYYHYYRHDDHVEVKRALDFPAAYRWIVSYDDVEPIREIYSGFPHLKYSIGYSAREHVSGSEIMFFGPGLVAPAVQGAMVEISRSAPACQSGPPEP